MIQFHVDFKGRVTSTCDKLLYDMSTIDSDYDTRGMMRLMQIRKRGKQQKTTGTL